MKVLGQLEGAQLEQIASASPTPTPTGRMYMDVRTPAAAVPMIYNGTAWRQLKMGQSTSLISQNSGKAVTVNWANGLYQQVVLTDDTVISFSNPVAGETHVLVVSQKPYAAGVKQYNFIFNMSDQATKGEGYQPKGIHNNGLNKTYAWFYSSAIRAAYATIPNITFAPRTAPAAQPATCDFSPSGKSFAMSHSSSPFHDIYRVGQGGLEPVIGPKNMVTPLALAAASLAVAFSPDGNFYAAVGGTSPYIQCFPYVEDAQFLGTVLANPGTLPTGAAKCVAWHPSSSHVAVGHATSPFMSIYPILNGAFGTKMTDPSTLPAAQVNAIAFAPQGDYLAAASQTTPFIQVWAFDNSSSTVGSAAANPSTLPDGGPGAAVGKGIAWRPQGDYIAMAMSVSPYLYVVPFNRATGAFGSALSITALSAAATAVQWTPDGQYLLVSSASAPYLYVYDFSASTIGTAIAFDGSNPGQAVNDICIHPSGDWALLALNASAYLTGITLPNKQRNYLRL